MILSSPINDRYFHECLSQPIVSKFEISSCSATSFCRYVEHLFAPLPVLHRLFNKDVVGPGFVGPDAKATGPRPVQHPSGPRGARHDACADSRNALKNKTARTTTRTSRQFFKHVKHRTRLRRISQLKNLSRQLMSGSSSSALTLPRSCCLLPVLASVSPSFQGSW